MTQAVTFDDVWRMFQEMIREDREQMREDRERMRENREWIRENKEWIRENKEWMRADRERWEKHDRKTQEIDRQLEENAKQIKETDLITKENAKQMKETDLKMKETAKQMKETDRKIGQLGGRLGEFVEGLVAPACKTLFAERGIPVHKVSRRVEADLPGDRHIEIDLFVVNTDAASLVEVKSKLTIEDVRDHMTRLGEFKDFFPEYSDKRVIGAVAGMVVEDHVIRFAIKNGLFVIVQAGDQVRLANDLDFVPRVW